MKLCGICTGTKVGAHPDAPTLASARRDSDSLLMLSMKRACSGRLRCADVRTRHRAGVLAGDAAESGWWYGERGVPAIMLTGICWLPSCIPQHNSMCPLVFVVLVNPFSFENCSMLSTIIVLAMHCAVAFAVQDAVVLKCALWKY